MPKKIAPRGFTLLELLVGAAVGAVVLLGISLTFISQARQYQAHASRRAIQSNARQSMAFIARHLRNAGYGVNPDRAILPYDSFDADDGLLGTVKGGYPDALVTHSRDPLFRRTTTAATATQLTVDAPVSLPQGQILLVLCRGNSAFTTNEHHAFVTVGTRVENSPNILLDTTAPSSAPNSPIAQPGRLFHEQARLDSHTCYDSAQVVRINRAAFYVASFPDTGSARNMPYLMMHQGIDLNRDNQINVADAIPIAEGIEQMQVAYILNAYDEPTDPPAVYPLVLGVNEDPMLPDTHRGENWEQNDRTGPPALGERWYLGPPPDSRLRTRNNSANIAQVRVTLVARSSVPEPQHPGDNLLTAAEGAEMTGIGVPWRQLENLSLSLPTTETEDFTPSGGHYYRTILRQTITPKNMSSNSQFVTTTLGGG